MKRKISFRPRVTAEGECCMCVCVCIAATKMIPRPATWHRVWNQEISTFSYWITRKYTLLPSSLSLTPVRTICNQLDMSHHSNPISIREQTENAKTYWFFFQLEFHFTSLFFLSLCLSLPIVCRDALAPNDLSFYQRIFSNHCVQESVMRSTTNAEF